MENSGGGLDSILFCFIVNLLLWLQDQVIYGSKLWGMNLKGYNTTDSRETSQFTGTALQYLKCMHRGKMEQTESLQHCMAIFITCYRPGCNQGMAKEKPLPPVTEIYLFIIYNVVAPR